MRLNSGVVSVFHFINFTAVSLRVWRESEERETCPLVIPLATKKGNTERKYQNAVQRDSAVIEVTGQQQFRWKQRRENERMMAKLAKGG